MRHGVPDLASRDSRRVLNVLRQIITSRISKDLQKRTLLVPCDLTFLIDSVAKILKREPPLITLDGAIIVVGDIHGNIDSLLRILERFGYPPHAHYLFLGDYIDRGRNSCEVILVLYALKFLYPNSIHLIRGNHEFLLMSESYGFKRECENRLSLPIFDRIMRSFARMPIVARVGGNLCVHGGISPQLRSTADLDSIRKCAAEPVPGLMCDILWSDPRGDVADFTESPRGIGFLFGEKAVRRFIDACPGIDRIIRAHESCREGFDWPFSESDAVLTVFSSCDYCEMMNDAAVAFVNDGDASARCVKVPPLYRAQLDCRRVTFPDWLIEEPGPAIRPDIAGRSELEIVV